MTIKNLCRDYDIFMFDLDRTIFDTYTKNGEPIWAKQMIQPFVISSDGLIKDDCESTCRLQSEINLVLEYLKLNNKQLGFISRGGVYNIEYEKQPSVLLLKMFGIYDYFSYDKLLFYKTEIKANHLSKIGKCVFFDDMDVDLDTVRKIDNIKVIDRTGFKQWSDLL